MNDSGFRGTPRAALVTAHLRAAPRSQDMPIKYMFIAQRRVYDATEGADAGCCQAQFAPVTETGSDPAGRSGARPIRSSKTPRAKASLPRNGKTLVLSRRKMLALGTVVLEGDAAIEE
jgi:hypothetical protein